MPPIGSKWANGLSVSRPNIFAVPSPSRYAASAWANSWIGKAISSMTATTMTAAIRSEVGTQTSGWVGTEPIVAAGSEAGQELRLLRLVLLGADRIAVTEVGKARQRAGHLVRAHLPRRRGRGGRRH